MKWMARQTKRSPHAPEERTSELMMMLMSDDVYVRVDIFLVRETMVFTQNTARRHKRGG